MNMKRTRKAKPLYGPIYSQEQLGAENHFQPFAQQQQQALAILGGSGYQRGVEVVETGINCETFEVRYFPEVNEKLQGIGGESFLKAVSTLFSRDVTVAGEVNNSTGVMAYTTTTACTVANDTTTYGGGNTVGTLLLDDATESQGRTAWRAVSVKLSSNPLLIVA